MMEKFMTKEFTPGLALDSGEFIPASDINAQTAAPPVPTSATWGDWREPTTVAQRLGDVLQLLCGGKRPPDDVVLAWLDAELDDIGLQHFCAQHGPAWAQGIALIDLAMVAVKQPTEGADHEQVEIEPQVATANEPSYIARLIDSLTMPPQAMAASDLRALHEEAAAMLNLLSCQGLRPKAPPAETVLINGLTAEETFATASCSGLTEPRSGAAYAALPMSTAMHAIDGVTACWPSDQMRAFADATCALRAAHGQAPAQAAPDVSGYVSEWAGGICTAGEAMAGIAKLYGAQTAPAAVAGPSGLRTRCEELLAWRKTGVLSGEALRTLAREKYGDEYDALQRAERDTETEALNFVIAAPTTHPSPAAQSVESNGWLHENGLLYRLTDERYPTSRDEINVTMADGSRSIESRSRRALELLDCMRATQEGKR